MKILGDTVELTREEMNEYFQMTLEKEWYVGLNNKFELVYNSRALGFKVQGVANYYIEFFEDESEDYIINLPVKYNSTLTTESSLDILDNEKIVVNSYFQFGTTSTENGEYTGSTFTVQEDSRILDVNSTNLNVGDKVRLAGKLDLSMSGNRLKIEDIITDKIYYCESYTSTSPLYERHLKITNGAIVRYIPMSNDSGFEPFRTPLKIGGIYVLTKMEFQRPSAPTITMKGFGKMILESDDGSWIIYNGEAKPTGSTWKNLTRNTVKGNAYAYYPASGTVGQSENSDPLYITMLGYPDLFQKHHWDKLSILNSNTLTATLRAFRIDNASSWEYYTQYFNFNAGNRRTILESHSYQDVFDDILQVGFSHRWAFQSTSENVIDSAIIAWRGNHGLVERRTEWSYTDYTDRPWDYHWENN